MISLCCCFFFSLSLALTLSDKIICTHNIIKKLLMLLVIDYSYIYIIQIKINTFLNILFEIKWAVNSISWLDTKFLFIFYTYHCNQRFWNNLVFFFQNLQFFIIIIIIIIISIISIIIIIIIIFVFSFKLIINLLSWVFFLVFFYLLIRV